jgi:hypothetical protein
VTPLFEHHSASRDRLEGCYSWLGIEPSFPVACRPVLTNRLTGVVVGGGSITLSPPLYFTWTQNTKTKERFWFLQVVYPFYHPRLRKLPNGI